jgi:hypothetical protein
MISLEPRSPNYYRKKIQNKILLKIFRFFQLLHVFLILLFWGFSLGIFYFPDKYFKKTGRRGFIVSGYKGFPEVRMRGACLKPESPYFYL